MKVTIEFATTEEATRAARIWTLGVEASLAQSFGNGGVPTPSEDGQRDTILEETTPREYAPGERGAPATRAPLRHGCKDLADTHIKGALERQGYCLLIDVTMATAANPGSVWDAVMILLKTRDDLVYFKTRVRGRGPWLYGVATRSFMSGSPHLIEAKPRTYKRANDVETEPTVENAEEEPMLKPAGDVP